MFSVKSESDRKSRVVGFLFIGAITLFGAGFSFFMAFSIENNITFLSIGFSAIYLAISIFDFWAAWKFSRAPLTPPHS